MLPRVQCQKISLNQASDWTFSISFFSFWCLRIACIGCRPWLKSRAELGFVFYLWNLVSSALYHPGNTFSNSSVSPPSPPLFSSATASQPTSIFTRCHFQLSLFPVLPSELSHFIPSGLSLWMGLWSEKCVNQVWMWESESEGGKRGKSGCLAMFFDTQCGIMSFLTPWFQVELWYEVSLG